jgi:dTDP-4-dehydrorhamnose reductase
MTPPKKFLVLGASGLLGKRLFASLHKDIVVGTYCSTPIDGGVFFDATKMRLRDALLRKKHNFKAAYILFGSTNLDVCANNPTETARINVEAVQHAIDDLMLEGIKPVFASSDAVFDGSAGLRTESNPANPILSYGKQKLQIENYLATKAGAWVVARLSKLVSSAPESRNILAEWARDLEQGGTIRCAKELIFSPADVDDVAKALILFADEHFTGLFHACGPKAIRRLDMLNFLAAKISAHREVKGRIVACTLKDLALAEARPIDQSMDPTKLYSALGFSFRRMEDLCSEFVTKRYI